MEKLQVAFKRLLQIKDSISKDGIAVNIYRVRTEINEVIEDLAEALQEGIASSPVVTLPVIADPKIISFWTQVWLMRAQRLDYLDSSPAAWANLALKDFDNQFSSRINGDPS